MTCRRYKNSFLNLIVKEKLTLFIQRKNLQTTVFFKTLHDQAQIFKSYTIQSQFD